jgi:hypothetical protein
MVYTEWGGIPKGAIPLWGWVTYGIPGAEIGGDDIPSRVRGRRERERLWMRITRDDEEITELIQMILDSGMLN